MNDTKKTRKQASPENEPPRGDASGEPASDRAIERVRRPRPARTRPIREPSTLFRNDSGAAGAAADLSDAVSQSVRLGYSVLRDQIERGRRTAQQFAGGNGGAGAGFQRGSDLNEIGRRMLDFSSDFGTLYGELLETLARLPGRGAEAARADAARAGTASSASGIHAAGPAATRVVIEVDATRPSRVALDLGPGLAQTALCVRALLGPADDVPPLTGIAFETGTDPLLLRISVPDGQPAGVYTGVVVERDTNAPKGTLSITLL